MIKKHWIQLKDPQFPKLKPPKLQNKAVLDYNSKYKIIQV